MILVIKHIVIEGPGRIAEFFEQSSCRINTIELGNGGVLPKDLTLIEAVILLGGPMNVYEEERYPFLKEEDVFLKKVLKEKIPVLGVCLGAQLLAKACGARITKAEKEEIGWGSVQLTEEGRKDPLFQGMQKQLEVFQWHSDAFEVPKGGILLAEGSECCNQVFRWGTNAYGLQFHIEVTPDMIESWIIEYLHGGDESRIISGQRMLIRAFKKERQFKEQINSLLLNFCRMLPASAVNK